MTTVYVCGNHELLSSGRIEDQNLYEEEINSAVGKTCRFLEEQDGIDDVKVDSFFRNWSGGKFYQTGTKIGGDQYGHKLGFVATFEKNPSEQLIKIIDDAHFILTEELDIIGIQENEYRAGLEKEREEEEASKNET